MGVLTCNADYAWGGKFNTKTKPCKIKNAVYKFANKCATNSDAKNVKHRKQN